MRGAATLSWPREPGRRGALRKWHAGLGRNDPDRNEGLAESFQSLCAPAHSRLVAFLPLEL